QRLAEDDRYPDWLDPGQGNRRRHRSARRACRGHEARIHLWPRTVRAFAHHVGDQTFPARSGGAHSGTSLSRRCLSHARSCMSDLRLTIDGQAVTVPAGTTVFDAARLQGIAIPTLCHQQNETPVGVCRLCVVEAGGRVLSASCIRPAEEGMTVTTNSDKVRNVRRTLLELLMADHPSPCARQSQSGDCELETLARQEGLTGSRFSKRLSPRGQDDSSFAIAVDHEACILCDRCIRGCGEIRNNFVLGRKGKGYNSGIAFDLNKPMGNSSCVSCGECVVSCPTGALTNKFVVQTELGGEPADVED